MNDRAAIREDHDRRTRYHRMKMVMAPNKRLVKTPGIRPPRMRWPEILGKMQIGDVFVSPSRPTIGRKRFEAETGCKFIETRKGQTYTLRRVL